MKIEKLDLGFKIDVGAPRPVLLVDEHKVYLIFYTQIESKIAVVNFSYYDIFKFGIPSDEDIPGHPYAKFGVVPYSAYVVNDSEWIVDLDKMNKENTRYSQVNNERYKHYIFFFHDSCFECVAKEFEAKLYTGNMKKIIKLFSKNLK